MAKPDWGAIKAAYQAGETARSIAARFGISHTAINNRAKKEGWVKLSAGNFPMETGNQSGNLKKSSKKPATPDKSEPATTNPVESEPQESASILKPQHEQFAQNIAQGMPAKDAAVCAGYSPSRAESQASILLRRADIKARIQELRNDAALLVSFNAGHLAELSYKSAQQALKNQKFSQVAPNVKNAAQLTGIDMSTNKTEVNVDLAGLSYGKVCIVTPANCPPEVWASHMEKLREGKQTAQS
jgi:hypothetical protein